MLIRGRPPHANPPRGLPAQGITNMPKTDASCDDLLRWLKANFGRSALAPLTGTDFRALAAVAHIVALYAVSGNDSALSALHDVVLCMQPSTRELAFHAIAHQLDWDDRARVWGRAGLPPLVTTMRADV